VVVIQPFDSSTGEIMHSLTFEGTVVPRRGKSIDYDEDRLALYLMSDAWAVPLVREPSLSKRVE